MRVETRRRDTRAGAAVVLPVPFPQLAPRFLLPCSSVRSQRSSLSVWVVFHLRDTFLFLHYSTAHVVLKRPRRHVPPPSIFVPSPSGSSRSISSVVPWLSHQTCYAQHWRNARHPFGQ